MIVRGGLLALPGRQDLVRADIHISEGRIVSIEQSAHAEAGEEVIDAGGLHLFPGAVDSHVHFDTPGFEHREDFEHGSMSAARGGVTTVVDMPCTSLPPVTSFDTLKAKLAVMSRRSVVDFALYGGLSGREDGGDVTAAMAALAPSVVGFKAYFLSGMASFPRISHYDFARAVARCDELGRPLLLHAEDADYVTAATAVRSGAERGRLGGTALAPPAGGGDLLSGARAGRIGGAATPITGAGDGRGKWSDYVASRPEAAELAAAASALALARGHEKALHVVHVGTAAAAELLSAGGATCETCPHYLAFSSEDFTRLGSALKTAPPVKAPGEAAKLWALLARRAIVFVTSDHAPAPEEEKRTGSVWTDYGGIPGTGTLFPYLYSEGLRAGRLSLSRFLEAASSGAALRFGLAGRKGSIEVGKDADFLLIDPDATSVVRGSELLSKGKITPFEGMRLSGAIVRTYLRGRPVWDADHGITVDPGYGRYLTWGCA